MIGIHGRMRARQEAEEEWIEQLEAWQNLGADYLSIKTLYEGLEGEEQVDHIETVASVFLEAGLF